MTKDELKKAAIRHALAGGRKFGSAEHKELMGFIASQIADNASDKSFCLWLPRQWLSLAIKAPCSKRSTALVLIDRLNRKQLGTTLFSELAAEKEKS